MNDLVNNKLVRTLTELRSQDRKALLPFITAGYPDLETTADLLKDFVARGVRICELGIPFSDPIADGPVIQASYTEALAAGIRVESIFEMVKGFRAGERVSNLKSEISNLKSLALVAMVSYSIVFRHGPLEFMAAARDAGFDGLIVPDLPLEEAEAFESLAASHGLCNIMLIAPTTPANRRYEIARHSRGFIYFISVAGITGERTRLPEESIAAVAELRKHTSTPICMGFGVSSPEAVARVCEAADGAIVGSVIVHRIADAAKAGLDRRELVAKVGQFVGELLAPTLAGK